jgi:hypothetical protein
VARVTLTPTPFAGAAGFILSTTTGAQSLSGYTGVQFINNGALFLAVYNGSGSQTITQLIGGKVQGISPTVSAAALTASTNFLYGNWSQKDYTQLDGSGMQYIDFGGTQANVSVTLYALALLP